LTYTDVYIGQLGEGSDPLDWGGDWNGNVPARLGPFFPPNYGEAFRVLVRKIETVVNDVPDFIRAHPDGSYALVASEL
jgi:hypothetical protein